MAVAPRANAQDVAESAWWHALQAPQGPTRTALLESVQATSASVFDPKLPAIPLEKWLSLTLGPFVEVVYAELVVWQVRLCLDPLAQLMDSGSQLCVRATVALSEDRNVQLVFLVADSARGAAGGPPEWRPTGPSLRDVYIERLRNSRPFDSLDVPALGALSQLLNTPFEQWPMVDFETTVTWDPQNPAPGDIVRFSISVRNTSKRSVERVQVEIVIGSCCANATVRQQWFTPIAAGQSVRVDGKIPLPEGRALGFVTATPFQRDKIVRESDPGKPSTDFAVGMPGWYPPPRR
jgi:hypothetical protein